MLHGAFIECLLCAGPDAGAGPSQIDPCHGGRSLVGSGDKKQGLLVGRESPGQKARESESVGCLR